MVSARQTRGKKFAKQTRFRQISRLFIPTLSAPLQGRSCSRLFICSVAHQKTKACCQSVSTRQKSSSRLNASNEETITISDLKRLDLIRTLFFPPSSLSIDARSSASRTDSRKNGVYKPFSYKFEIKYYSLALSHSFYQCLLLLCQRERRPLPPPPPLLPPLAWDSGFCRLCNRR